jgi:hypothetical protein
MTFQSSDDTYKGPGFLIYTYIQGLCQTSFPRNLTDKFRSDHQRLLEAVDNNGLTSWAEIFGKIDSTSFRKGLF